MEHLDPITALLWSEGELDARTASQWHRHITLCSTCRQQIAALERESRWLRNCLQEAPQPAAARPRLALAAALSGTGLALAGALTVWLTLIAPWLHDSSRMGYGGQNLLSSLLFSAMFWNGWASVTHIVEVLGPLAFLACAWLLLRPRRAGWSRSALGLLLLLALSPFAKPLAAQTPRSPASSRPAAPAAPAPPAAPAAPTPTAVHENFYTLPAGATVPHDLFIRADDIRIDGTLDGNLFAFAQNVTIDGQVNGDVVVFSGTLHVAPAAKIGGDLISFVHEMHMGGQLHGNYFGGNQVTDLSGSIGGSSVSWSQQLNLQPGARVGGELVSFDQILDLEGAVHQGVLATFQSANLNGQVDGRLHLRGDRLNIGPVARIGGRVMFHGRNRPTIESGAQLGQGLQFEWLRPGAHWRSGKFYLFQALAWAAAMLAGLVLWLLFPGFFAAVERQRQRIGASLGAGAVLLIALPVLAVLAGITLVGLPLAVIALFCYLLAIYLSSVFVAVWLGNLLLGVTESFWENLLRLALGLLLIRIVLQIPYAGGLALLAIVVWGLGLQALAAYELFRRPRLAV